MPYDGQNYGNVTAVMFLFCFRPYFHESDIFFGMHSSLLHTSILSFHSQQQQQKKNHNNSKEQNGDVPLFVRGQQNGGGGGGGGGVYNDGGHDSYDENRHGRHPRNGSQDDEEGNAASELRECQRKLVEWTTRADEATQLNFTLEQELQSHAAKRMDLERELNDVHRKHQNEVAVQKVFFFFEKHI
jgi:hypothetical protein